MRTVVNGLGVDLRLHCFWQVVVHLCFLFDQFVFTSCTYRVSHLPKIAPLLTPEVVIIYTYIYMCVYIYIYIGGGAGEYHSGSSSVDLFWASEVTRVDSLLS